MKTETKIAEENIKPPRIIMFNETYCKSHKASCQRFLRFLQVYRGMLRMEIDIDSEDMSNEKINDLKNAIKKYDEAGI